jgi:hypothetical protein
MAPARARHTACGRVASAFQCGGPGRLLVPHVSRGLVGGVAAPECWPSRVASLPPAVARRPMESGLAGPPPLPASARARPWPRAAPPRAHWQILARGHRARAGRRRERLPATLWQRLNFLYVGYCHLRNEDLTSISYDLERILSYPWRFLTFPVLWRVSSPSGGRAAAHQPLLQCAPASGAGTIMPFTLPIHPMGTATALTDKDSQLASQKLFEGYF